MTPASLDPAGGVTAPQRRVRLTKTQKAILGMLIGNGGRGLVYTGKRTLFIYGPTGDQRCECNEITPYFMTSYGLIRDAPSNHSKAMREITQQGREAHRRGSRALFSKPVAED